VSPPIVEREFTIEFLEPGRRGLRLHLRLSGYDRCVNEEELRRAQERHALAMQASDEGYWDWIVAKRRFLCVAAHARGSTAWPADTEFAGRADFLRAIPSRPTTSNAGKKRSPPISPARARASTSRFACPVPPSAGSG